MNVNRPPADPHHPDAYLECVACRWAYPISTTLDDEPCTECGGALVVRLAGYEPSCPRCGQTGSPDVCARCLELERAPQGHAIRLFEPAPTPMAGQLEL